MTEKGSPEDRTRETRLPHAEFRIGQIVADRYRLEELVGVGGMGLVYRAQDLQLEIPVALKLLRPELTIDDAAENRFRHELILARQITHPNVVRVHDLSAHEGQKFISMDFVQGETLATLIKQQAPLPVERARDFLRQIADGLAAAHAKGVIHRDLKPGNILVDENDQVYITDFGVAHSIASSGLTRTGDTLGTLDYLSPEQARGDSVDTRSDLYTLGLIAAQLLTGELPFAGSTSTERLSERLTGSPKPQFPESVQQNHPDLVTLVEQLLDRDPQRRPDSADEVAARLSGDVQMYGSGKRSMWPYLLGAMGLVVLILAGILIWPVSPPAASRSEPSILPPVVTGEVPEGTGLGLNLLLTEQLAVTTGKPAGDALYGAAMLEQLDLSPAQAETHLDRVQSLAADALIIRTRLDRNGQGWRYGLWVYPPAELRSDAGFTGPTHLQIEATTVPVLLPRLADLAEQVVDATHLQRDGSGQTHRTAATSAEALGHWANGLQAQRIGDLPTAMSLLEQAVTADPQFLRAWLALAEVRASYGNWDGASEAAMRAADLAPENSAEQHLASAQLSRIDGDYEAAIKSIEQLQEQSPHDPGLALLHAELVGEGLDLEQAIEELQVIAGERPHHPRLWYLLGKYSIQQGDSRTAVDEYLVKALVLQNRLGNLQGRADVVNALGVGYERLGQYDRAVEEYRQASELRRQLGDVTGAATSLRNLAGIFAIQGQYEAAGQHLQQALDMLTPLGPSDALADVYNDLGFLQEEQGQYQAALEPYRQALALRQKVSGPDAIAQSHLNLGFTYYLLGEFDNAQVYASQARAGFQNMSDQAGLQQAEQLIARLSLAQLNWEEAEAQLRASLRAAEGAQMQDLRTAAHYLLAEVLMERGLFRQALSHIQSAENQYQERGDQRGLIGSRLLHAELLLRLQAFAEAQALIDELGSGEALNVEQQARVNLLGGQLAESLDGSGEILLEQAQQQAEASGNELLRLEAAIIRAGAEADGAQLQRLSEQTAAANQNRLAVLARIILLGTQLSGSGPGALADSVSQLQSMIRGAESLWLDLELAELTYRICLQQPRDTDCQSEAAQLTAVRNAQAAHLPEAHQQLAQGTEQPEP